MRLVLGQHPPDTGVTACCGVFPVGRSPFTPAYACNPEARTGWPWRLVTCLAELDLLRNAGPWYGLACPLCARSATV